MPVIIRYFFVLLKLLYVITQSCKTNWRRKRTKTCGSIFFCRDKLLVGNSDITEVNELKNIKFTLKIFRMQFFTFIILNTSDTTRLILKTKYRLLDQVLIVFHNLMGYEAHLFIMELGEKFSKNGTGVIAEKTGRALTLMSRSTSTWQT